MLYSTHMILAAALKTPEVALEKDEAKALAEATAEVAKHYPTAISPVTIAWVNLATCVGLTYVPRVYMISKRNADKKPARPKPQQSPTPAANTNGAPPTTDERAFIFPLAGAMVGDAGNI